MDNNGPIITITTPNLGTINAATASGASAVDSYSGIASYAWTDLSGPSPITFSPTANIANPTMAGTVSGAYEALLTVTDNVGNISSSTVSFIWSDAPGSFSVTNPHVGDYLMGGVNTNVIWTAPVDNNLDHFFVEYSLDNGGAWVTIDSSVASSTTSIIWAVPVANSTSTIIRVTAFDSGSNQTVATSSVFVVDSSNPIITISTSTLGTINTPTASGASAVDTYSGVASYAWTYVSGPGTITFSPTATSSNPTLAANISGAYVALLTVTDNAGNTATSSVDFIWSGNPGGFVVLVPDGTTKLYGGENINISWTQPSEGIIDYFNIDYSLDNGASWTGIGTTSSSTNLLAWTAPATSSIVCLVRVTAFDIYTNQTIATSANFIIDSSAPIITVASPDLGIISVPKNADVSISDAHSGLATILWTKVSGPGAINLATSTASMDPSFSATLTGDYVVMVEATDLVGNISSSTVIFSWAGDPATPYITNPVGGSYLAGNTTTTVIWVSSGEADLASFTLWYSDNNGNTWSLLDAAIASTTTSFPWLVPGVDNDNNLFKLAVFDNFGNSTTTVSLPFSIDSTFPSSVSVTDPNSLSLPFKFGSTINVAWSGGTDAHLGATPILIEHSVSGNFDDTITLGSVANSGTYSFTAPNINTATNTKIRVTSIDLAGNRSVGTSSSFIIDSLAPVITLTADFSNQASAFNPAPGIIDNIDLNSELTYAWTMVSVPVGGDLIFSVPFIANPSISGSVAGIYVASLSVTDRAGNVSTSQTSFNWLGGSGYPDLIYPTTGDSVPVGDTNILWMTPNLSDIASYMVEYSDNGGGTWVTLISGLASTSTSTLWTIAPGTNSSNNMIRVTAYDAGGTPFVANGGLFTIDSSAPVIDLGSSLGTISVATAVTASSTDNFDDAGQLTYAWSIISNPVGANLIFSSSTVLVTSLSGNIAGDYSALLTVTDRAGNSATSSVSFTWYIAPSGGGGGGGGGGGSPGPTYCSAVVYSDWGLCANNIQTRTILSQTPGSCTLTSVQTAAQSQVCNSEIIVDPGSQTCSSIIYTSWGTCVNGSQSRTIYSYAPIGCSLSSTQLQANTQSCVGTVINVGGFDTDAAAVMDTARDYFTKTDVKLVERLRGQILIATENKGRAWYVNPADGRKYYLGSAANAYSVMRIMGDGMANRDLQKINIDFLDEVTRDIPVSGDTFTIRLDKALGKNWQATLNKTKVDPALIKRFSGHILIQVQTNGEAWYLEPKTKKRYYLGRPAEAYAIMRAFGLGVTNENLNKIPVGKFSITQMKIISDLLSGKSR